MTNKEAFQEFAKGFTFCIGIIALFILFIALLARSNADSENKFVVVDKYKECDVVRYTDRSGNWNYFLDCSSK